MWARVIDGKQSILGVKNSDHAILYTEGFGGSFREVFDFGHTDEFRHLDFLARNRASSTLAFDRWFPIVVVAELLDGHTARSHSPWLKTEQLALFSYKGSRH